MFDKLQAFFVSSYDVRGFVDVKVCEECSEDKILENCSCIIGLHPDQATGAIVEFAVKHRKPFIVVPCCVFSRLFPNRFVPSSGTQGGDKKVVSTKDELVEWCVGLDPDHIKSITTSLSRLEHSGLVNIRLMMMISHKIDSVIFLVFSCSSSFKKKAYEK